MRILLDTNILLAAIITEGGCFDLFKHCIKNHSVIGSNYIINEFKEKLKNKFHFTAREIFEIEEVVFERIELVEPKIIHIKRLKDKEDLPVIGTAISGKCHCIITGDKELQKLKRIKNIVILKPSDFWKYEIK